MIHESAPWKDALARDADLLQNWAAKTSITSRRSTLIEKKIFLAAYAIRKLIHAHKVSSSFEDRSLNCRAFCARQGQCLEQHNNHRFDEIYDLTKPTVRKLNVKDALDIIIHSLVFVEALGDQNTVEGFLVTSDRKKETLWDVDLSDFISLMRQAARDYPSSFVRIFDPQKDRWVYWAGTGDPPAHVERLLKPKK